jgi:hypothetical protein
MVALGDKDTVSVEAASLEAVLEESHRLQAENAALRETVDNRNSSLDLCCQLLGAAKIRIDELEGRLRISETARRYLRRRVFTLNREVVERMRPR